MLETAAASGAPIHFVHQSRPGAVDAVAAARRDGVWSDAGLVVLDPNETREVRAARLHMETGYSPYEGLRVTGWPAAVIARGRLVLDRDRLIDPGPVGEHLRATEITPH